MPVVLGSNPFSIVNNGLTSLLGSPVAIDPSQILITGSGSTYTIRFGAGPGVFTRDTSTGLGRGNSLADGNFLLTIDPSKITDQAALQTLTPTNSFGDGDNEFGDRAVDNFFRLFGDADGNGVVNSLDTGAFGELPRPTTPPSTSTATEWYRWQPTTSTAPASLATSTSDEEAFRPDFSFRVES